MSGVASPTVRSVVRPVASSVVGSDVAGGFNPLILSPSVWLDASKLFTDESGTAAAVTTGDRVDSYANKADSSLVVNAASGTARPTYDANKFNLQPCVVFDASAFQSLSGPTSKSWNLRNFTIAFSQFPIWPDDQASGGVAGGLSARFQLGSGSNLNLYSDSSTNDYRCFDLGLGTIADCLQPRLFTPGPMIVRGSAGAFKLRQFGYESSIAARSASTGTVLNIGNLASSYWYEGMYQHFLMFDSVLSDEDCETLELWLASQAGMKVANDSKPIVVLDGDSITTGESGATNFAYSLAKKAVEGLEVTAVCPAIAGQTAQLIASRYPTRSGRFLAGSHTKKIVVLFCGTNDLTSATAAATIGYFESAADAARTAGATDIIAVTMLPRGDATFETKRQTFNAALIANASSKWDYVADCGGDPTMGPYAARLDTGLYTDATHPTNAGVEIISALIKEKIQEAIAT